MHSFGAHSVPGCFEWHMLTLSVTSSVYKYIPSWSTIFTLVKKIQNTNEFVYKIKIHKNDYGVAFECFVRSILSPNYKAMKRYVVDAR
jgi:hypothetical protein